MDDPDKRNRPQTANEAPSRRSHRKKVPMSATMVPSVPPLQPDGKLKRRTAASATTQRVPISPPICGVQPGKVLELRTSLGLMRAKAILRQQQQQQQQHQAEQEVSQRTRGQLKSARLQPLGIVSDPVVVAEQCLGVMPVSPRGDKLHNRQRPRSSTAPGVHFDLPGPESPDGEGRERVGKRVKLKRRSYSAVSARSVNTQQLLKSILVSRHTGLVPQKFQFLQENSRIQAAETAASYLNAQEHPPSNRGKTVLPPVVHHGELGMKIEVKGLRGTPDTSNDDPSPNTPRRISESNESPKITTKLPPIADSPSIVEQKIPNLDTHSPKSPTTSPPSSDAQPPVSPSSNETLEKHNINHVATRNESPKKVTIVSIGEAEVADETQRGNKPHRRKRHPSGSQTGRLSLGWSSPKPIEPLKGNSLPTPSSDARTFTHPSSHSSRSKSKAEGTAGQNSEAATEMERVMSPNMISVDVNEFLSEVETTDTTQ